MSFYNAGWSRYNAATHLGSEMKRRQFISLVGAVAAWPWSASAEAERRLGVLMPFPDGDPLAVGWLKALRQSLAGLGWHEGGNLKIEVRWSEGDGARSRAHAE